MNRPKLTDEQREAKRKERLERARVARGVMKRLIDGWREAGKFESVSKRGQFHTVEYNGEKYRCTCIGFKATVKRVEAAGCVATCQHIRLVQRGVLS